MAKHAVRYAEVELYLVSIFSFFLCRSTLVAKCVKDCCKFKKNIKMNPRLFESHLQYSTLYIWIIHGLFKFQGTHTPNPFNSLGSNKNEKRKTFHV